MTDKLSQADRILAILQTEGHIDNFRAIRERISLRLGARIWELRAKGFVIETKELPDKNTVYTLVSALAPTGPSLTGFLSHLRTMGVPPESLPSSRRAELYQEYARTFV